MCKISQLKDMRICSSTYQDFIILERYKEIRIRHLFNNKYKYFENKISLSSTNISIYKNAFENSKESKVNRKKYFLKMI